MRIVIQRVSSASVQVNGELVGKIDQGFLVLVGVGHDDDESKAEWLAEKVVQLRVFPDENGKMNLSLADVDGQILVVSQFTLLGDCRKGRRPAFTNAGPPDVAKRLYEHFAGAIASKGITVQTGIFAADMKVSLVNDGPVTLILDR